MKKFSKILIFTLSLVIALSAFAIASSANTSPFLVEGLYRENWEEAIENAYIKGDRIVPVELLTDYEANGESVEITESVVISLNGHTLKSAAGAPLFSVSGKDTTLTIIGPGTISCEGTLIEVESGSLVLDASRGLSIVSESSESVAVLGGSGKKAYASVTSNVNFESSAASLFELGSGAEFTLATGGSVTAKPTAAATDAFAIVLANAGSKVDVRGGALANSGGYIFKVGDDTVAEAPISISCESAVLVSDSASYGSIVEAGAGHANVDVRYSEVVASGGAFSAANTLLDYEGEGRDKVYAKPTLRVNFVVSTYKVTDGSANSNASLFYGNVTGIVTASVIQNTESSAVAINTRLWDGECGILIKKGNKFFNETVSDNLEPVKDEDGAIAYFNPASESNKNFSLEAIDGESCKIYRTTEIGADNSLTNCYIVTDELPYFVDTTYSSTFSPSTPTPIANAITQSYGELGVASAKDKDGVENHFLKWEYDASKKDQYSFASGNSYFELDGGSSSGSNRGFDAIVNNEIITWDFDISTSNGTYSYAGLKMFIREKGASYAYTDNTFAQITNNTFKVGNVAYELPTTPYVWAHITLVLEPDTSGAYDVGDGVICYPNLKNSQIHFFANGEYISSTSMFSSKIVETAEKKEDIKKAAEFCLDSIRFGMSGGPAVGKDTSTSLLIDNDFITYYPKGYTGSVPEGGEAEFIANVDKYNEYLADNGTAPDKTIKDFIGDIDIKLPDVLLTKTELGIKDAYDVVYKKGYRMPGVGVIDADDRPVLAIVDGIEYRDIDEALRAIVDNSVVRLFADVEGEYNATSSFTVYTKKEGGGNYKFNVVSDSYYLSDVRENGVVVGHKTMLANSFITIYWQINTGYKTEVPVGIVPKYDWIVPSAYYDEAGRCIELIGWSSQQNATVPEEIGQITKDDLIKGYKVYYPVIAPSKVPVTFVDAFGTPVNKIDVPVGASEESLKYMFDGSFLPALSDEGNDWYEKCYSSWDIPGDTIGMDPVIARPVYDDVRIKTSVIKTSFTVVRLVDFSPTVYVLKPDSNSLPADEVDKVSFAGFSLDGRTLLEGNGDWNNQYNYNVTIGGKEYYKLNFSRSKEFGKPGADILDSYTVYIHYTYDGVAKAEPISFSISSYLEAAFAQADKVEDKSAIIELMRLVVTYSELAEKTDRAIYATCKSYVENPEYASYLSDYTKAMDGVSDEKKAANEAMLAALYEYADDNIRWNFVTNSVTFTPLGSKYPGLKFVNAFSVTSEKEDGIMVQAHASGRMNNGFNGVTNTYTFTFSFGSNSNYGSCMITAYDKSTANGAADMIKFEFRDQYLKNNNSRPVLHEKYYNLTAHITELERRIGEGETGLESELKMAQIILASQFALAKCTTDGANVAGTFTPIPATLPNR